MKDIDKIKCSKYIANLDIREKAAIIMVITKIKSGILLMSSIYFRFFQTVLPMLTMLNEHEDNKELKRFVCKKFSSILRTYIRTNNLAKDEQPSVYALLNECYDVNLDPAIKQIESHVVITLGDIDKHLDVLMSDILSMTQDTNIDKWKDHGRYDKICDTLSNLLTAIFTTYEDIGKAFFDGNSNIVIDEFIGNKRDTGEVLNSGIDNINSLIAAIEFDGSIIHCLYNDICRLQYYIETVTIDIVAPIIMGEDEKSIKELYSDFAEINDTAIKNDARKNGFDISYLNKSVDVNKPTELSKWSKKKTRFYPSFFNYDKRNNSTNTWDEDATDNSQE